MKVIALVLLAVASSQGAVFPRVLNPLVSLPMNSGPSSGKIVGGQEATPNSSPWQVTVSSSLGFCGGSLIKLDVVLTAAHCVDQTLSRIEIIAGAHDRTNANEATQQVWRCNSVAECSGTYTKHPNWNPNTLNADVAVIRLSQPFVQTNYVKPIPLAASSQAVDMYDGKVMTVTGWGRTSDASGAISSVLRTVDIPGITNAACRSVYGTIINNGIVCASTQGGHGTCNGDSGGPMTLEINGVRTQVGIVSFVSSTGCEAGLPAGFTSVAFYRDFIDNPAA